MHRKIGAYFVGLGSNLKVGLLAIYLILFHCLLQTNVLSIVPQYL